MKGRILSWRVKTNELRGMHEIKLVAKWRRAVTVQWSGVVARPTVLGERRDPLVVASETTDAVRNIK